jgi:hypothetical protein
LYQLLKPMRVYTVIFILLSLFYSLKSQVVINEYLSFNVNGILDDDQEYTDWLEIYNAGSSAADLTGYSLSDDLTQPQKWVFPALSLQPAKRFLVYASGKDRKEISLNYETIIDWGDDWRYLVPTSDIGTAWHNVGFNDNTWSTGISGFGYSDNDDSTILGNVISVFIRKEFVISDVSSVIKLILHMDYDDGFVAYINGHEVARSNIGTAGVNVPYSQGASGDHEANIWQGLSPERYEITNPSGVLLEGTNVLAIQGHNKNTGSSDLTLIPFLTIGRIEGVKDVSAYLDIPAGGGLHTNFKLKSKGESIYLFNPAGILADSIGEITLPADVSFGRKPDGANLWYYFAQPTPDAENTAKGYPNSGADPVLFSRSGGKNIGGTTLSLTAGKSTDTIYYTTDGSIPDPTSNRYTGPITIGDDQVIRARVIGSTCLPGPVSTNTYVTQYNHQIPIVCISTNPENLWSDESGIYVLGPPDYSSQPPHEGANYWEEWERPAHFELYDKNGIKQIDQLAGVKIFGGWSRMNEQKSLALFARKEYGKGSFEYKFFTDKPIEKFESIVIRNSGNDNMQLQFHDCFMTGLTRKMEVDRQAFQPAAIYLNGKYWGIENIREKVNEHYLAENHLVDPGSVNLLFLQSTVLCGTNTGYQQILTFLNNHSTLQNNDDYYQVRDQIDLDNYIQYQLTQIYLNNKDWPGNNIKFWNTNTGNPWRWIIFDTDFGFNAGEYGYNTLEFALVTNGEDWPNPPWSTLLFRRMISNLDFRYNFINQYCDRLNVDFHPSRINADLDSLRGVYYADMQYHFERWWGSYPEWESRISSRKIFGQRRPALCRLHMQEQFSLGEELEVKVEVSDADMGKVKVNTVYPYSYPFTGIYFRDVPISLKAVPKVGFKFVRWEGSVNSTERVISYNMAADGNFKAIFEESAAEDVSIVINEINYASSEEWNTGDWIELFNNGNTTVDFEDWLISDSGVDTGHYFQAGIILYPGDYLVVCRDLPDFRELNPGVTSSIGNIPFGLSSSGDIIRLYDAERNLIDAVDYYPYAPWPENAVETGSSIELKNPSLDNTLGQNWQAVGIGGTPGKANYGYDATEPFVLPELLTDFECFPNPFTDFTTIQFTVASEGKYRLEIYDIKGQLVDILADKYLAPDTYSVDWYGVNNSGQGLSGGIYTVRLSSGNEVETIKLIMIK